MVVSDPIAGTMLDAKKCQRAARGLDFEPSGSELLRATRIEPRRVFQGANRMHSISKKTSLAAALLAVSAGASAAEYARVVSAKPVAAPVSTAHQECVDGEQIVQPQPSGAGAAVGAIAGGVIGNQFGHGFGRAAATGIGAVAGSAIGNNVEASANPPVAMPTRNCRTVNGVENRVVGYDIVYEYNGQRYSTRLPEDPGPSLAVEVRPADNAPPDHVGPPATYGAALPASTAPAPVYSAVPAAYYPAPARVYYPAPVAYPAAYYVGPAIGFGVGYWAGRSWAYRGRYYRHWH
jgi:uncharacterized protein YcfJ